MGKVSELICSSVSSSVKWEIITTPTCFWCLRSLQKAATHVEQIEAASPGVMQGTKAGPHDKALFLQATRECPQGSAHRSPSTNNLCPTVSVMGLETHRTLRESGEISLPLMCTASPPQSAKHSYIALRHMHIHHRVTSHLFNNIYFFDWARS